MAPILPADLRNLDADGRVRLNGAITREELARQGLTLDVGLALIFQPINPSRPNAKPSCVNSPDGYLPCEEKSCRIDFGRR